MDYSFKACYKIYISSDLTKPYFRITCVESIYIFWQQVVQHRYLQKQLAELWHLHPILYIQLEELATTGSTVNFSLTVLFHCDRGCCKDYCLNVTFCTCITLHVL